MDERGEKVLSAIIENHIQTADPVGSRFLSKSSDIQLSPATIRNVMMDLTELGYIEQPHTSAGRVPTDKGYRYYVDKLMKSRKNGLSKKIQYFIQSEISEPAPNGLERILKKTAGILSQLTEYTAIALSPKPSYTQLKKMELIKIREHQILAVFVTQSGLVSHRIIEIRGKITQEVLDNFSRHLNKVFYNRSLAFIRENLLSNLYNEWEKSEEILPSIIRLGKKAFEIDEHGKLYIDGQANIFQFPEFCQPESLKDFYLAFEDEKELLNILNNGITEGYGTRIKIGIENQSKSFINCTVISSDYGNLKNLLGTIAVLGPTRMDYNKVIPIVSFTAKTLSDKVAHLMEED